ncbi:hypothetical protein BGZ70_001917 [Mortierella alpina]|uniref:WLM-domain-containing protein n=1 Tax=Mortierella alpina TaxID=64518 RepID=A0A9P6IVF3_MORAP|nr:hypothetical protein BGZ70_001917 [Mortierella alpina]
MAAGEQSLDHFATITCLTSKPNHEEAMRILRRVATMVRPIMKAHKWKTEILAEFYPKNLLGMNTNRGWKIQLCLRHHDDVSRFLPWEDILGTMLHELAHNIRGPHDAQFYKAMNDLNDEYDKIIASGYTGVGFDATGQRLGGRRGLGGSTHGSREAAILAAERRRRVNEMMLPAGGRKLGGGGGSAGSAHDPTSKAFWEKWHSPGELAALAAEQRAKDQVWCGSTENDNSEPSTQVVPTETQDLESENRKQETGTVESAVSEASSSIHIKAAEAAKRRLQADSDRGVGEGSKKIKRRPISTSSSSSSSSSIHAQSRTPQPSRAASIIAVPPTTVSAAEWSEWSCPTCTLLNKPLALQCDCCLTERPLL